MGPEIRRFPLGKPCWLSAVMSSGVGLGWLKVARDLAACAGAGGRERSRSRRTRDGFRRIRRRRRPGLVSTCAPVGRSAYEASVKEYWDRGVTLISGLTLIEPATPGGEDRFQVGFPGLFRLLFSV